MAAPETWEELLAACEVLDAAGFIPITAGMKNWNAPSARWFASISLRLHGADFYTSLMHGDVSGLDPLATFLDTFLDT